MEKIKIMLVDDSSTIRTMFASILNTESVEVVLAADPIEALEKIKNNSIACILSDYEMPHMTGLEFCREIKSNPNLSNIPFVLLTMHDEDKCILECLNAGADDFLIKRTNPEIITKRINVMIELCVSRERQLKEERYRTYAATINSLNDDWNKIFTLIYPMIDELTMNYKISNLSEEFLLNLSEFKCQLNRTERTINSFQNLENIQINNHEINIPTLKKRIS